MPAPMWIILVLLYIRNQQVEGRPSIQPDLQPINFNQSVQNIRDIPELAETEFLHQTVHDYSAEIQKLLLAEFQDSEVSPGLFEGDIAGLPFEVYLQWRLGLKWDVFPERRWKNNTVPYVISNLYSPDETKVIQAGIDTLNFLTCIDFVPYDGKVKDYIFIYPVEKPAGCWSFVGRIGGQQPLSLTPPKNGAPKCLGSVGKPIHEVLHALGVFHEHSRADRDDYILIKTENIIPKFLHNFKKGSLENTTLPYKYDYNSVMHYGDRFFSIDRKTPSIVPKDSSVKIGQRKMLSRFDCLKVNQLYGCMDKDNFSKEKYTSFCGTLAL